MNRIVSSSFQCGSASGCWNIQRIMFRSDFGTSDRSLRKNVANRFQARTSYFASTTQAGVSTS